MSDEAGRLATPYEVVQVRSPRQAIAAVLQVVGREGVGRLVVGIPLNMDGSAGPAAHDALAWAQTVASQSGLPLVLVDERLSSFEAEQQLTQRRRLGEKLTRRRARARLDAVAAAGFLQAFLDGKLPAIAPASLDQSG
jgi:putative Holliday junction resolvase